jgi:hypothetical protein
MPDEISANRPGQLRPEDVADAYQRETDEEQEQDAFRQFAKQATSLARIKAAAWTVRQINALRNLLDRAIAEAEARAELVGVNNPYAKQQALENVLGQLRKIMAALEPPPEIAESEEFQALMKKLGPHLPDRNESDFSRRSIMSKKVRSDVLNRQVNEAVRLADKRAARQRADRMAAAGASVQEIQSAAATLQQLARMLKKRRKKKKGNVAEPDEVAEAGSEYELTVEDAEELAFMGLELMQTLREELAPAWSPEQQPWMVNAADNEVYAIILAAIPKELFEETQAFGKMQDLRAGQEVFTLRAADKLSEAARRKE